MPTAVPITDWPIEHVNVVNLLLDEHNTRLDSDVHSQDAIIRELFESEDAFAIVRSIADRGYFTNDLPIVTNEDVTYTVLEGNRRTAALKAILNPRLVYQYQPRIEKLFDGRDLAPLEKIQVMVAPTRDDALQLLAAIHTTQSRKKWDPLRQAQFFKAQHDAGKSLQELGDEYPQVDIARFARMWQMHNVARSLDFGDDDETPRLIAGRGFGISTLERVYDSDQFRKQFGVEFDRHGRMSVRAEQAEFASAFTNVVRDVAHKHVSSRTLNTNEDLDSALARWGRPKLRVDDAVATAEDFEPKEVEP